MAAAYAFILAYSNSTGQDGQRRKLPKVDLDAEVNLNTAWDDMKDTIKDLRWGQMPRPSSSSPSLGNNNSTSANNANADEKQQPSSRSADTK